jgi:hypothetical protein
MPDALRRREKNFWKSSKKSGRLKASLLACAVSNPSGVGVVYIGIIPRRDRGGLSEEIDRGDAREAGH